MASNKKSRKLNKLRNPFPSPLDRYLKTPDGLFLKKGSGDGELAYTQLTNFTARIVREYDVTDGVARHKELEIEATVRGENIPKTIRVKAADFVSPKTRVVPLLGTAAIVYPGWQCDEHVRAAIQELSGHPPVTPVFTHTGWARLNGQWLFLHAGGAIGTDAGGDHESANCPNTNINEASTLWATGATGAILNGKVGDSYFGVRYDEILRRFRLPAPPAGEALVTAIKASLRMLDVGPDRVIMPLYAAIWRAVLGHVPYSVYLDGETGNGKSLIAALAHSTSAPP